MKRYLLFAGDTYYPNGGMSDFVDASDSIYELIQLIPDRCDWWHIFDMEERQTVRYG